MGKEKYSREDAFNASMNYFNGDSLGTNVFLNKYAMADSEGNYLEKTPDAMHRRMAKEFAKIERNYGGEHELSEENIYQLFKDFKYIIPGGSVMNGLGNTEYRGSLSNCFVVGAPKDSYASIMRYRDWQVEVMKNRGGAGIDISNLRPSGSFVTNAAKTSSGPVSFMEVNSELTKEVSQNGRRGALMISINGNHPDVYNGIKYQDMDIEKDIPDFISKKQDLTKCTGANISIQFTDEFMRAVIDDKDFYLRWPVNTSVDIEDGSKYEYNQLYWIDEKQCIKRVKAKDVWDKFIYCSWKTAEPGIMYRDKHINLSPDGVYDEYRGVTTNPCGEIFMSAFDSCRLMHVNLASFVESDKEGNKFFNYDKLYEVSYCNMQLCDDLVDSESMQIQKIIDHVKENYTEDDRNELELWENIYKMGQSSRRAGCGITGLSDALALLGIRLDSNEALETENRILKTKMLAELKAQVVLAKERGTFKNYSFDKEFKIVGDTIVGCNDFFNRLLETEEFIPYIKEMQKYGRRNVSWSTMAPVGSGALLCQGSSGIEPVFELWHTRRKKCMSKNDRVDFIDVNGEKFTEYFVLHRPFVKWIIENCSDYDKTKSFEEQVTEEKLNNWKKQSPWDRCTASELSPERHVEMQEIGQKYTTHSISKTCNLPNTATMEDISNIFIDGWKHNLKGVTVYRDGCRNGVMVKSEKKDCDCKCNNTLRHDAPRRPKTLPCDIKRFRNGGDRWIACVGLYNGQPYEIFTGMAEKLSLPDYVDKAEIIKYKIDNPIQCEEKVSRYDIVYVDREGNKQIVEGLNSVFNPEFYNYSKLISGLLRQGMPIEYVHSTLKSMKFYSNTINTWRNGVLRAFKAYIIDGEVEGEVCPKCGGKIVRENGCRHCVDCGFSFCN